MGVQLGWVAEVRFETGLAVGFRTSLVAMRSQATDDQTRTISSLDPSRKCAHHLSLVLGRVAAEARNQQSPLAAMEYPG